MLDSLISCRLNVRYTPDTSSRSSYKYRFRQSAAMMGAGRGGWVRWYGTLGHMMSTLMADDVTVVVVLMNFKLKRLTINT